MLKKISNETIEEIQKLYAQKFSIGKIAKKISVPYSVAYTHARLTQRINPDTGKLFESYTEYREYLAGQKGFGSIKDYTEDWVNNKGFDSVSEYNKQNLLKRINPETKKPFKSKIEYENYLSKKRGFKSWKDYLNHRAAINGFDFLKDYTKHLSNKNKKKPENKELGGLIKQRLEELGKSQVWLAGELRVSKQVICLYCTGRSFPRKENLNEVFLILDLDKSAVKTKSLEKLLAA